MKLKKWFETNKRTFPWRDPITPYRVWVSEVMLQQTLATVVIPYFKKWMKLFPSIQDLAKAPVESVIKTWEGLGYYSRARNLHSGAKYVLENHGGDLPSERDELLKIKGIGDYTVGAILSFAFKQKEVAVDGNVKRVIARFFAIKEDISKPKTLSLIKKHVHNILPNEEPWIAMEALIELGATVCMKKPECEICPLKDSCMAYRLGIENELPIKKTKIKYENIYRTVLVLKTSTHILVNKVDKGRVMQDLHEFPYIETNEKGFEPYEIPNLIKDQFQVRVKFKQKLPLVKHSFTRFRARLTPLIYETDRAPLFNDYFWVNKKDIHNLPFSSGHRKILKMLVSFE